MLAKMPSTRTTRSRNPGTQSSSRNQKSKNICTPTISKYFSKATEDAESPYKNVVSEVQSISFDDAANDDDFKSPPKKMVQLKPPKVVPKVAKKSLPRRSSTRRKNPMQKTLEDNFNGTGVNGEHLQMALALSESSCVADSSENLDNSGDAQEKAKLFKQALEKFGLRCGGKPDRNPFEAPKPRYTKKSRYRFVTPILKMRTDEERQSLLASKVSLLLSRNARFEQHYLTVTSTATQNNLPLNVHSDFLKENLCPGFENFRLHSLCVEELTEEKFYVRNLNLTRSEGTTCGCLLKSWTRIAGRELSPSRQTEELQSRDVEVSIKNEEMIKNCEVKNWTSEDTLETSTVSDLPGGSSAAVQRNKETEGSSELPSMFEDVQAVGLSRGRVGEIERSSTQASQSSKETLERLENKAEGYRTDSEDLETFAFSNLTDLLRPSPEEAEVVANNERRSISPDLFDDSSESLLSPIKISPASKKNTETKNVEQSNSSDIVQVDLTRSSEDEEASCNYTTFIDRRRTSGNLGIVEKSMKYEDIDLDKTGILKTNFEMNAVDNLTQSSDECKEDIRDFKDKENDVIEETPHFDYDATIILSAAERDVFATTRRREESEDNFETPDLDFGRYENGVDVSRISAIERSVAEEEVANSEASPNLEQTEDLNVTDYVMHILNNRNSSILKGNSTVRTELFPESTSFSQESITLSDEELNYSSALSKSLKRKVSYELSSDSEPDEDCRLSVEFTRSPKKLAASSVRSPAEYRSPEKPECSKMSRRSFDSEADEDWRKSVEFTRSPKKLTASSVRSPAKCKGPDRPEKPECSKMSRRFQTVSSPPESKSASPMRSSSKYKSSDRPEKPECSQIFEQLHTVSPPPEPRAVNLLNDSLNNILESSVFDKFTTPCSKVLIKTDNVTPMPDYDEMDTPKVTEALDKFGLKPLKRKKGAKFLKYIYESTHPLVEPKRCSASSDDEGEVVKKRRLDDCRNLEDMDVARGEDAEAIDEDAEGGTGGIESEEMQAEIEGMLAGRAEPIEILGDALTAGEELVFERSRSRRLPSCRVPLQIVWHNFVSANPNVRENILLYEPLQLEVLHAMLKQQGYKFNVQDLLTFLDKKCITIRTNSTGSSGRRKPKKS